MVAHSEVGELLKPMTSCQLTRMSGRAVFSAAQLTSPPPWVGCVVSPPEEVASAPDGAAVTLGPPSCAAGLSLPHAPSAQQMTTRVAIG